MSKKKQSARVYSLAVLPDFQNKNLASQLLQSALKNIKGRYSQITLEVRRGNKKAINLYTKFGFYYEQTLKEYYADKEDAIKMRKEL